MILLFDFEETAIESTAYISDDIILSVVFCYLHTSDNILLSDLH